MKTLRQVCAVTILSLTLAISVFAGHIECPGATSPPPPPSDTATPLASITTTAILTLISLVR